MPSEPNFLLEEYTQFEEINVNDLLNSMSKQTTVKIIFPCQHLKNRNPVRNRKIQKRIYI